MSDCLFCKIIAGEIPSNKVYEDEKVYAFEDIAPMAKNHLLFVHKEHTSDVNEIATLNPEQLTDIYVAIAKFTRDGGHDKTGFRVVTNTGPDAGQTVFHLHLHLLAGKTFAEGMV